MSNVYGECLHTLPLSELSCRLASLILTWCSLQEVPAALENSGHCLFKIVAIIVLWWVSKKHSSIFTSLPSLGNKQILYHLHKTEQMFGHISLFIFYLETSEFFKMHFFEREHKKLKIKLSFWKVEVICEYVQEELSLPAIWVLTYSFGNNELQLIINKACKIACISSCWYFCMRPIWETLYETLSTHYGIPRLFIGLGEGVGGLLSQINSLMLGLFIWAVFPREFRYPPNLPLYIFTRSGIAISFQKMQIGTCYPKSASLLWL